MEKTEYRTKKKEMPYQKIIPLNEQHSINLNSNIPQWVKILVELYSSPLKYEIQYRLKDSGINRI
jgi:hypothetical protein